METNIEVSTNGTETKEKKNKDAAAAFEWVNGIIESCRDPFQLGAAKKLVDFYTEIYNKQYGTNKMIEDLKLKLVSMMDRIYFI